MGARLLGGTYAQAGGEKAKADVTARAEATSELRVQLLAGNLPIVVGTVGGRPGINIMIDTGTSTSVIDARLAKSLGLELVPGQVQVLNGIFPAPGVWLPDVELGPVHQTKVPGLVGDLSHLKERFGVPVGLIVGLDVLGEFSFRLDYESKTLTFGEVCTDGIAVPVNEDSGFAYVNVEVRKKRLRLLVDTGASTVVLFRERVDPQMEWLIMTKQGGVQGLGARVKAAGNPPWKSVDITFNGNQRRAKSVYLVTNAGQFKDFDGLLAVHSLGFHALSYDHEARVLYLE